MKSNKSKGDAIMKKRKLLSIFIVLAMISAMTAITASAADAYTATFVIEGGSATITTYATQDYSSGNENQTSAVATNSDTGEVDVGGSGQINFTVIPEDGYEVASVTATSGTYKNIKGPTDTGLANTYRITKVTDDMTVTVTLTQSTDTEAEEEDTGDSVITFSDSGISQTGSKSGTSIDGTTLTITAAGTYTLTGSCSDGNVVIAKNAGEVTLILNSLTLTSTTTAPVAAKSGTAVTISLPSGTSSTLTDTYRNAESPKSCLNSGGDLIFTGSGTLTVNGNNKNGIKADGNITVEGVTLKINSLDNSLAADNILTVNSGKITAVSAEGDCIKSEPDEITDTTLGQIVIKGGTFNLTATANDGIQALDTLTISGGDFTIKTGGGSTVKIASDDDGSYKGIKSDGKMTITGGTFDINSADDSVHTNYDMYIGGGNFTINSGDDGIHADGLLTIDGGTFDITAAEGIEATRIVINNGDITISASDDGINAAQKLTGYTVEVVINGGTITIKMGQGDTDGIDSNGNITINGGTIYITAQSAFDYDGTGKLNGGTVYVNGTKVTQLTNQFGGGEQGGFQPGQGTQPGQGGNQPGQGGNQPGQGDFQPGQGGTQFDNTPGGNTSTDTDTGSTTGDDTQSSYSWLTVLISYITNAAKVILGFVNKLFI